MRLELFQKVEKNELLACLVNGIKSGEKFPESVRQFCFSISYHSPAAYEIIRSKFNNHLPHPKTLKSWLAMSDIKAEPGVTEDTMKRLKGFVQDLKGEPLVCGLIFDEISIRQQIYFDESKMDYVGGTTYGANDPTHRRKSNKNEEQLPIAKKAINFMLSSINKKFQFPVAYHFVDALTADELATLITEVILKVSQCEIKVATLTFDGDRKNIAACISLGANLEILDPKFQPYIENPYDKSNVYLILDPSHMEKLMRNLLGNRKVLYDEANSKIEWNYFIELEKLSKGGNMHTHKLTRKHIEFNRNSMNVRLAVETFSRQVGDSFQILKDNGHPCFEGCESTTNFVYMMDDLFNVFNSRTKRNENIYKCALSAQNKDLVFQFIDKCANYLKNLKMEVTRKRKNREVTEIVPVYSTINKTPIIGFLMDMHNLKLLYAEYIADSSLLCELHTYTFSQDHIEIFHSKIRARNGHNSNPNVVQYKGAFRQIACNLDLKAPESANCYALDAFDSQQPTLHPQSNVYFISSRRPKLDILSDETFQKNLAEQENDLAEEFGVLESIDDVEGLELSGHMMDGVAGASIAYAARVIEKKIETQTFYCDCCKFVFAQNPKLMNRAIYIIDSKRPCVSTFYICKIADRFIKLYEPTIFKKNTAEETNNNRDFRVLFYMIFKEIDYNRLFEKTDFKNHEAHKFHLVKCIVQEYIRIKTAQISKQVTLSHYDKLLRSRLTRWIHFAGQ